MRKLWILPLLILSFTAVAAADTWPQLAIGGGYQGLILVSNNTGSDWTGQFFPKQGHEKIWAGTWRVNGQDYTGQPYFNVSLHAHATAKFVLTGDDALPVQAGYLFLWGTQGSSTTDVSIAYFFGYVQSGKLIVSTGSEAGFNRNLFHFPVEYSPINASGGVNTGIAWAPELTVTPPQFNITATLYITDKSGIGQLYGSKTLTYSGHAAQFINEMFPELTGTDFRGYLVLQADYTFFMEVLRLDSTADGFLLTRVPPDRKP
jgi:hypothetical protein